MLGLTRIRRFRLNSSCNSARVRSGCSRIQARSCSRAASSTRLGNPCRACGTRSIFPVRKNCCRAFFANPTLTQNRCANSSSVPSPAAQAFSNRQRRSSDIGFGIASAENLRAPSLSHPLGPPVYSKIDSALMAAACRCPGQSGNPLPTIETRHPSDQRRGPQAAVSGLGWQRERPKQKVAVPLLTRF